MEGLGKIEDMFKGIFQDKEVEQEPEAKIETTDQLVGSGLLPAQESETGDLESVCKECGVDHVTV